MMSCITMMRLLRRQLNDYTYHQHEEKRVDSRYLHRGNFDWEKAEFRKDSSTPQGALFAALRRLENIRASENLFRADAKVSTFDTGSDRVLGVCRELDSQCFCGLFNFSEQDVDADLEAGVYTDLVTGALFRGDRICLQPYGFCWMKKSD